MRQSKKLKLSIYAILFLNFNSCLNDDEIKEGWWKYGDGFYLGDVLTFYVHGLRNDTIFINSIPKAIIIARKESVFGLGSRKIVIKDVKSDDKGEYIEK